MAKRSASWRRDQQSDPYLVRAQQEGWRSRAVYKLAEIHERERLFRRDAVVIDLGSAPGGWSQFAARLVGPTGQVIAVDLLPMDPVPDVSFIQGDFADETIYSQLLELAGERRTEVVMSDMAPNISGIRSVDQPRAMALAELALELAEGVLRPGGNLVVKLFHGAGFDEFVRQVRERFEQVKVRKPEASRPESRETYLVARTYRL